MFEQILGPKKARKIIDDNWHWHTFLVRSTFYWKKRSWSYMVTCRGSLTVDFDHWTIWSTTTNTIISRCEAVLGWDSLLDPGWLKLSWGFTTEERKGKRKYSPTNSWGCNLQHRIFFPELWSVSVYVWILPILIVSPLPAKTCTDILASVYVCHRVQFMNPTQPPSLKQKETNAGYRQCNNHSQIEVQPAC